MKVAASEGPRPGVATPRMATLAGLAYGPWLLLLLFPGLSPLEVGAALSGMITLLLLAACRGRAAPLAAPRWVSGALWASAGASLVYLLAPLLFAGLGEGAETGAGGAHEAIFGWALLARALPALLLLLTSTIASLLLLLALARDLRASGATERGS